MKTIVRELLRDLKAAATLGKPEAVDIALDGLLALPGVASNNRLPEGFLEQVVLPVGNMLASLPPRYLRPLATHSLVAGRAIGAVVFAHHFVKGEETGPNDLLPFAQDPRPEVRLALGRSLLELGEAHPDRLLPLAESWLRDPRPRLRSTALVFLPALSGVPDAPLVAWLQPLGEDESPEVRRELAEALKRLATQGWAEPVLGLLSAWAAATPPKAWLVCRTLSGSWAADHPARVDGILRVVYAETGVTSSITNALRALRRHGVDIRWDEDASQPIKDH